MEAGCQSTELSLQTAPSFNRPAATGRWWWSFTPTRTTSASQRTLGQREEARHERAGHRRPQGTSCGPRLPCPGRSTMSGRPVRTASSTLSPRPASTAGPTRGTAVPGAQSESLTGAAGRTCPWASRRSTVASDGIYTRCALATRQSPTSRFSPAVASIWFAEEHTRRRREQPLTRSAGNVCLKVAGHCAAATRPAAEWSAVVAERPVHPARRGHSGRWGCRRMRLARTSPADAVRGHRDRRTGPPPLAVDDRGNALVPFVRGAEDEPPLGRAPAPRESDRPRRDP